MKIFAESQVVREVPYVHLGYTAALDNYFGPPVFIGPLLALVGLALAFSPPKNWKATLKLRMIFGGVALAGVLTTFIGLELAKVKRDRGRARISTMIRLQHIRTAIAMRHEQARAQEPVKDLAALMASQPELVEQPEKALLDGWGRAMELSSSLGEDQKPRYVIRSAGADGQFNTVDDISVKCESNGFRVAED